MSDLLPASALNAVADALMREYGYLPHSVRYRAASAACEIVQAHEAKRSIWDTESARQASRAVDAWTARPFPDTAQKETHDE